MFDLTKDKKLNLPSSIKVGGRFFNIRCTVKDGIEFAEEMKKKVHSPTDFDFLFTGAVPEDRQGALDALIQFFYPKKELPRDIFPRTEENPIPYDYMIDADLIWSAFMSNYGIDLIEEYDTMHWYKFRVLFDNLRDCKLVDVMGYRSYSNKEKMDNKRERALMKQAWEIVPEPELTAEQIASGNKFDELSKK